MKSGHKKRRTVQLPTPAGVKTVPLADALSLMARAKANLQWQDVARISQTILQQVPGEDDARLGLYQALTELQLFEELQAACEKHLQNQPRNLLSLEYIAHSLRQTGKDEDALPYLERAVSSAKTDTRLINALGTLHKELGNKQKASDCFDRVIAIKPTLGKAWWNRSDLEVDHQQAISSMEAQLKRLKPDSKQRPYFHFALYRSYEAMGDTDNAFRHLENGNRSKKALLNYRVEPDLEQDQNLIDFFRTHFQELREKIASSGLEASKCQPIFIVGMPRSGTSLVEQILASHSDVTGCGEIAALPQATEKVLRQHGGEAPFPQCITSMPASALVAIGESYQRITDKLSGDGNRITDKFLLNYKAVPLIALVLPKAKIIHVERSPMDTCFGCYRQLFTQGLGFSYDLDDLAKVYGRYKEMMSAWQTLAGEQIYRLSYEALVANPDQEISTLLSRCDLTDETPCHQFFNTERPVKTVSSLQVRQPVFSAGIERWKRYESHLTTLRELLKDV